MLPCIAFLVFLHPPRRPFPRHLYPSSHLTFEAGPQGALLLVTHLDDDSSSSSANSASGSDNGKGGVRGGGGGGSGLLRDGTEEGVDEGVGEGGLRGVAEVMWDSGRLKSSRPLRISCSCVDSCAG